MKNSILLILFAFTLSMIACSPKTETPTAPPFCYQGKQLTLGQAFTEVMQHFPKMTPMPGVEKKEGSSAMTYLSTGGNNTVNGSSLKATIMMDFDDQDNLANFTLRYICSCDPEKVTQEQVIETILSESQNCMDFKTKSHGTKHHFERYEIRTPPAGSWGFTYVTGWKPKVE